MKDQEFLMWLHERLTEVHGESPCVDCMHKLRAIIKATNPGKLTPNMATANNLEDLKKDMASNPH